MHVDVTQQQTLNHSLVWATSLTGTFRYFVSDDGAGAFICVWKDHFGSEWSYDLIISCQLW